MQILPPPREDPAMSPNPRPVPIVACLCRRRHRPRGDGRGRPCDRRGLRPVRRARAPGAPAVRRRRHRQARRPLPGACAGGGEGLRRRAAGRRRRAPLETAPAPPRAGPARACARSSTRSPTCARCATARIDLMVVRELTGGLYFGRSRCRGRPRQRHVQLQPRADRAGGALGIQARPPPRRPRRVGGQGERAGHVEAVAAGGDRAARGRVRRDPAHATSWSTRSR